SLAFKEASKPEPSPEKQADEAKSDLAKVQALLTQAAANPEVLLPQAFQTARVGGKPSVDSQMKEAIEAATGELKEWKAKLESLRGEVMGWEGQQNARRADRDKLFQVVAAMKAHEPERSESAGTAAVSESSQRLAHERRLNALWQSR